MSDYQFHSSWDIFTSPYADWVLESTFGDPGFGYGRFSGRCLNLTNTGFGVQSLYRDIPTANSYWIHFAYRQYVDPSHAFGVARPVFSIEKPSTSETLFKLVTRPGDYKLDCVAGSTTLTTNAVFTPGDNTDPTTGVWRSIEILYDASGDIKIYVDDVLDIDMNVTTSNHQPERVRIFWQNIGDYGVNFDDFALKASSSVSAATLRDGPMRINNWLLGQDEVTGWGRVGASSNAGCMHDHYGVTSSAPDGDTSFVQVTVPATDLYTLQSGKFCSGRIITIGTVLVAKLISGTPKIKTVSRIDPTNALIYSIGPDQTLLTPYTIFHGYADMSPRTNDYWTDGEVEGGVWGIQSLASGISRATMLSVEKIQTLRKVAYTCGQLGSYSFLRK